MQSLASNIMPILSRTWQVNCAHFNPLAVIHPPLNIPMQVLRTVNEIRQAVSAARHAGKRIGFVPTMGNLHAGHQSLLERAKQENEITGMDGFDPAFFHNIQNHFPIHHIYTQGINTPCRNTLHWWSCGEI